MSVLPADSHLGYEMAQTDTPDGVVVNDQCLQIEENEYDDQWLSNLQWAEEPAPLTVSHGPAIPMRQLPDSIVKVVESVAANANTDPSLPLSAALGTIAAATMGVYDVSPNVGWNAGPSTLYITNLLKSGGGKSAGFAPVTGVLKECERDFTSAWAVHVATNYSARKKLEKELAKAEKEDDWGRVTELKAAIDLLPTLGPGKYLTPGGTPEGIVKRMSEQGGFCAVLSTEGNVYKDIAGKYADRGKEDSSVINKMYDGDDPSTLLASRNQNGIDRAVLTWVGAVQPAVIAGYANANTNESGFLPRHLMFVPEWEERWDENAQARPAVNPVLLSDWNARIKALNEYALERYIAMHTERHAEAIRVTFSPEAEKARATWWEHYWAQHAAGMQDSLIASWLTRVNQQVARIAALLAVFEDPRATVVEMRHFSAAASLAPALTEHAKVAYQYLTGRAVGNDDPNRLLDVIRDVVDATTSVNVRKAVVSVAEIRPRVRSRASLKRAEDIEKAMGVLQAMGWVQRMPEDSGGIGGRPSARYALHPALRNDNRLIAVF